jgi:hypothetical protein
VLAKNREAFGYLRASRLKASLPCLPILVSAATHSAAKAVASGDQLAQNWSVDHRPASRSLSGLRRRHPPGLARESSDPDEDGPLGCDHTGIYLQIDLVSHSGASAAGDLLHVWSWTV